MYLFFQLTYLVYAFISATAVADFYTESIHSFSSCKPSCTNANANGSVPHTKESQSNLCNRRQTAIRVFFFLVSFLVPSWLLGKAAHHEYVVITSRRRLAKLMKEYAQNSNSDGSNFVQEIRNVFGRYRKHQGYYNKTTTTYNYFGVVQATMENFTLACTIMLTFALGSIEFRSKITLVLMLSPFTVNDNCVCKIALN